MNSWVALFLALLLLGSPWLLMPHQRSSETGGLLGVLWWVNAFYCAFWHRYRLPEREPMPCHGGALLICNHTSAIDHMVLQAATRRALGFVIAKELYDFWLYRPLCALIGCIPVKRDGRDLAATRAALRALKEGRVVPIFPEGRITPSSGRELGEGKPGVAFLAVTAKVPTIPAYIWGTPESIYFGECLRTPSHTRVAFGPPVDLSEYFTEGGVDRNRLDEVTAKLMDAIRALRDEAQKGKVAPGGDRAAVAAEGPGNGQRSGSSPEGVSSDRQAVGRT